MAIEANPGFNQNLTYSAAVMRRATRFMLARSSSAVGSVAGGFVGSTDCVASAPVSGMSFNVAVGEAVVGGTSSSTQSGYYVYVSSTTSVSLAASNPTNPRIDVGCLTINDTAFGAGSDGAVAQAITGTPAVSPVAPSLPASSLQIDTVAVAANATNIVSGNIGDKRSALAQGLAAPSANTTQTTTGTAPTTNNSLVNLASFAVPANQTYLLIGKASPSATVTGGVGAEIFFSTVTASSTGALGIAGNLNPNLTGTLGTDIIAIAVCAGGPSGTTYFLNGQSNGGVTVTWRNSASTLSGLPLGGITELRTV